MRGKFLKDVSLLAGGSFLAQLIVVATSPLVTRLYSPGEMGLYTLITTLVVILGPAINGRYDMSVITADDEHEAKALTLLAILVGLACSFAIALLFLILHRNLRSLFESSLYFLIIPLLIAHGITNPLTSYNNRHKQYKVIASVGVLRSGAQSVGQLLLGWYKYGTLGLLASQLVGSLLGLKGQAALAKLNIKDLATVSPKELKVVLKKYRNQPIFSTPALLLNSLSYSLINFLINSLYGVKELGYYSLAFRMLVLPVQLVSLNVARVFFERASAEVRQEGNCYNAVKKTAGILSIISAPLFLLVFLLAEPLFGILFGQDWVRAGTLVKILTPMFALRFVATSLTLVLIISGKQKIELLWQALFVLLSLGGYYFAKKYSVSLETFLFWLSSGYALNYIFLVIYVFRVSGKTFHKSRVQA